MAKKKTITKEYLIDAYMDMVIAQQGTAFTIEELCTSYNFTPEAFHEHFKNFEALDSAIFKIFIDNAISVLSQSPDYVEFGKKDRLLSLYYTLFENLTLNREFVLSILKGYGLNFNALALFKEFKKVFIDFVGSLQMEPLRIHGALETVQQKSIQEALWIQFLLTLKFWMSDDSPKCEKTDIFIEKSVNTGIELLNTKSLHNIVDLGKFLYAEKIKSK